MNMVEEEVSFPVYLASCHGGLIFCKRTRRLPDSNFKLRLFISTAKLLFANDALFSPGSNMVDSEFYKKATSEQGESIMA